MRVAVTGANGFIGRNLVRYLTDRGHEVRAIVRAPESAESLSGTGHEVALADVSRKESLVAAFEGMDAVVHLAALFNHPEASWQTYREVNVEGTRNSLEVAQASGVRRFVHCSTVGVAIGPGDPPFDEQTPYHYPEADKYETTKYEAERVARDFGSEKGYPVVVIRPAQVYGPGDRSKAKFYKMVRKGVIVNPGKTLKHLVYVDDLCAALESSLANERAVGEVFIIAAEAPTSLKELIALAARKLGVDLPRIKVPATPMTWLCWVTETTCNTLGIKPVLFKRSMDFFTRSVAFDTSKARTILGFETGTNLEVGVERTIDWYLQEELL